MNQYIFAYGREISIIVSADTKISLASEACCFTLGAGEAEIRATRLRTNISVPCRVNWFALAAVNNRMEMIKIYRRARGLNLFVSAGFH